MINPIESYIQAGEEAARARFHGDEERAQFVARHMREMEELESDEDRLAAKEAYRAAYSRVSKQLRRL